MITFSTMQEPLCRRPARAAMEAPAVAHGGSGLSPCFRRGLSAAARRRAHGLTLVELLVAVGILSMMILAFATIMNQSRKVVTGSQSIMRANTAAEAIMQSFRDSIRRMTQNGFLCIDTEYAGTTTVPRLYLTTAGVADSKTMAESGTGSFSCFGLCNASSGTERILWRQEWVLRPGIGSWEQDVDQDTIRNADLSQVQSLPRYSAANNSDDVNDLVNFLANIAPASLNPSPSTLAEVNAAWQLLASQCDHLTISWTDGSPGTFLQWYDKDNPQQPGASPAGWEDRDVAAGQIEYDADPASGTYRYRALWTKDNQSNWPRAIRVRFWLNDPTMQEFTGPNGMFYEVICPVAR